MVQNERIDLSEYLFRKLTELVEQTEKEILCILLNIRHSYEIEEAPEDEYREASKALLDRFMSRIDEILSEY